MAATITLAEAMQRVLGVQCDPVGVETVALADALGRHLAHDVATDGPWPSTDRSAMDGFAVAAGNGLAAGAELPVVGDSLAGHPFAGPLPDGTAIRIMTGAVVPPGADAVVPVELTSGFDGSPVVLRAPVQRGQNIRPVGSEAHAGQVVLGGGARIRAYGIGALAVLGHHRVAVRARPLVRVLPTGDEVVPVDQVPLPHQVRESNSWALAAQVAAAGAQAERLPVAPDDAPALRACVEQALVGADVLLTIGGVSKGSHDLVHGTLRELGVTAEFHGIELKPGKPTFFGVRRGARPTFVFGLPGNPASCITVFDLLVRPLLQRLLGSMPHRWTALATLRGSWKPNARLQATPVRLLEEAGLLAVEVLPPSPSGDPFSLVCGDAYALLPPNSKPGELRFVTIVPYLADGPCA
jgi:molybdopterin molybdotransferase